MNATPSIITPDAITEQTGLPTRPLPSTARLWDLQDQPTPVVVSASSAEDVSRLLAWANTRSLKVVPMGTGTKLDRGNPPAACHILLDLSALSGVVEHASGDLTVTVKAGTTLASLQSELARAGQFLALDPPLSGTVGGLIATNDSGPRRLRYGGVRDLLLGVTFVLADGTVARGGGRVVKNVAGYDLPKLLTGSMGTLGVITEATFRLYPLPPESATVLVTFPTAAEAHRALRVLLDAGLTPTAADYLTPPDRFAVRFESSEAAANAQFDEAYALLAELGARDMSPVRGGYEEVLWEALDAVMVETGEDDTLARLVAPPAALPSLLELAQRADSSITARAHLGHGHALLRLEKSNEDAAQMLATLRAEAERHGGALTLWQAPSGVRAHLDAWGSSMTPGALDLIRRVKQQFDPSGTLSPCRFVGGI